MVVLLSLASLGAWGQAAAGQGDSAKKQEMMAKLEKMSAELQLTPDQKKQMLPILMEEAPKMKAAKEDTSLGPIQKMMKLRQIGTDTDTKVKPILTPAQWEKWEAMRNQERQEMIEKMQQHKGA
jgi:hypothetical protein